MKEKKVKFRIHVVIEIIKHNKNKQEGDHAPMHIFIRYSVQMIHNCILIRFYVSVLDAFIDEIGVVSTLLLIGVAINGKVVCRFGGWLVFMVLDTILSFHRRVIKPIYFRRCIIGGILGVVFSICCWVSKGQTVICENYDGLT